MAELDSSIILGGKAPQLENPLDMASKAMAFKSLANRSQTEGIQAQQAQQQFNDENAIRSATNNNTTVDKDTGSVSIDRKGLYADLAKANPSLVPKVAQQFAANDLAVQTNQLNAKKEMMDFGGKVLGGVHDQASYDDAIEQLESVHPGSTKGYPKQFDPNFVQSKQNAAMSAKDLADNQIKQMEQQNKAAELGLQTKKFGVEVNKNSAQQNQETLSALQALRGNPALQRAETNVLSAKNINDLAEQVKDPKTGKIDLNKMNPQQISLFNHELLRMASGGSGSESDLENLKPGTPQYRLAELRQKLTGKVSGADAGKYIQQGLDYANTLSKSSNDFLYQNAKNVVDSKRNYLAPQDSKRYDSWLEDMKRGKAHFGEMAGSSSASNSHPDSQALDWARSHPKDSRAAAILKANGIR